MMIPIRKQKSLILKKILIGGGGLISYGFLVYYYYFSQKNLMLFSWLFPFYFLAITWYITEIFLIFRQKQNNTTEALHSITTPLIKKTKRLILKKFLMGCMGLLSYGVLAYYFFLKPLTLMALIFTPFKYFSFLYLYFVYIIWFIVDIFFLYRQRNHNKEIALGSQTDLLSTNKKKFHVCITLFLVVLFFLGYAMTIKYAMILIK